MSFFRHGEIYRSDVGNRSRGKPTESRLPRPSFSMSLRLVIPRRVALQQSPPPLHQPSVILKEKRKFEKEKPLNGKCANSNLSQRGGSPHFACVKTVSEPLELGPLEICFERRADSPSYCFFEKFVRKRRANRPGFRAPKGGALSIFLSDCGRE